MKRLISQKSGWFRGFSYENREGLLSDLDSIYDIDLDTTLNLN